MAHQTLYRYRRASSIALAMALLDGLPTTIPSPEITTNPNGTLTPMYAAAQSYVLERRTSSRNSAVMRSPAGDKIVIARGEGRHWIYFSVCDDFDNGSIIDCVPKWRHCKLGEVRQELRPWLGGARHVSRPHPDRFAREIAQISKDRARVLLELARMKPLDFHRYLEGGRGIPAALLGSERFAGKIRVDFRSNAVLPHADQDGPCGCVRFREGRGGACLHVRGRRRSGRPGGG
jgi:hypothetical protein